MHFPLVVGGFDEVLLHGVFAAQGVEHLRGVGMVVGFFILRIEGGVFRQLFVGVQVGGKVESAGRFRRNRAAADGQIADGAGLYHAISIDRITLQIHATVVDQIAVAVSLHKARAGVGSGASTVAHHKEAVAVDRQIEAVSRGKNGAAFGDTLRNTGDAHAQRLAFGI
ncbi:hypothetical protein D3C71_1017460 [compost metagenome]